MILEVWRLGNVSSCVNNILYNITLVVKNKCNVVPFGGPLEESLSLEAPSTFFFLINKRKYIKEKSANKKCPKVEAAFTLCP